MSRLRVLLGAGGVVAVACVVLLALGARSAWAAPGLVELPALALGVEREDDRVSVVHDGQLYAAEIVTTHGHAEVWVSRLLESAGGTRTWQQVGTQLNVRVGDYVAFPRLASIDGVLYAAWIERFPDRGHAVLLVSRLERVGHGGAVRWTPAARLSGQAPITHWLLDLFGSSGGSPVAVFQDSLGIRVGQLRSGMWELDERHAVLGAELVGGDPGGVYFREGRGEELPVYDGGVQVGTRWRFDTRVVRVGLDGAGGRVLFERTGPEPLYPLAMSDGRGPAQARGRSLIAWYDPERREIALGEIGVADAVGATIARISVAGPPDRLRVARLAGGIAIAIQTGRRLVLYRIVGARADAVVRVDAERDIPAGAWVTRLIAGPSGQPLLTYHNGPRAFMLGWTPDNAPSGR